MICYIKFTGVHMSHLAEATAANLTYGCYSTVEAWKKVDELRTWEKEGEYDPEQIADEIKSCGVFLDNGEDHPLVDLEQAIGLVAGLEDTSEDATAKHGIPLLAQVMPHFKGIEIGKRWKGARYIKDPPAVLDFETEGEDDPHMVDLELAKKLRTSSIQASPRESAFDKERFGTVEGDDHPEWFEDDNE